MQRPHSHYSFLAGALIALALGTVAQAQNARSYVSTGGVDTNNCTLGTTCRTFTRALSQTNSGGEIIVLDSGGYSSFTVSQPVTINATGVVASIENGAGAGLTINAAGDVTVTGLVIHGLGTGTNGVVVQQGFVHLSNIVVDGFSNDGIQVASASKVIIDDSKFESNGANGLEVNNASAKVYAHNTGFDQNANDGVLVSAGKVMVAGSYANYNTTYGFESAGSSNITLDGDQATFDGTGLGVTSTTSILSFARCTISLNTTADFFLNPSNEAGSSGGSPSPGLQGTAGPGTNQMPEISSELSTRQFMN